MEYYDNDRFAADPGCITISRAKVRLFHPSLFSLRSRILDLIPDRFRLSPTTQQFMEVLAEHLAYGDRRAALVISVDPYLVAAYADELDCVAILRFLPSYIPAEYMKLGSRLVTTNTYTSKQGAPDSRDLTLGPKHLGRYTEFWPIIADFLTDDTERLTQMQSEIDEREWKRVAELADQKLANRESKIRYGTPLLSYQMAT